MFVHARSTITLLYSSVTCTRTAVLKKEGSTDKIRREMYQSDEKWRFGVEQTTLLLPGSRSFFHYE